MKDMNFAVDLSRMDRILGMDKPSCQSEEKTMNLHHTIYWGFLCLGLCSCSTARFYSQALSGQVEMLRKARSVTQVLADPQTKPKLKDKLRQLEDRLFLLLLRIKLKQLEDTLNVLLRQLEDRFFLLLLVLVGLLSFKIPKFEDRLFLLLLSF